jgi:hypothetical protein
MRDAIIFRSRETGIAADFEEYPGAGRDVERYNPFEVSRRFQESMLIRFWSVFPGSPAHTAGEVKKSNSLLIAGRS